MYEAQVQLLLIKNIVKSKIRRESRKNASSVASLNCHTYTLQQKLMQPWFARHNSNTLASVSKKCDRLIAKYTECFDSNQHKCVQR